MEILIALHSYLVYMNCMIDAEDSNRMMSCMSMHINQYCSPLSQSHHFPGQNHCLYPEQWLRSVTINTNQNRQSIFKKSSV